MKKSSLLCLFISKEENEVLWLESLSEADSTKQFGRKITGIISKLDCFQNKK
jgi:hypothetical protein